MAMLPSTVALVAMIVVLGPSLGSLMAPSAQFWPALLRFSVVAPEPTEHARYLLSLLSAATFCTVVFLLGRRPRSASAVTRALGWASQVALAAFVGVCIAVQHTLVYPPRYTGKPHLQQSYFTWTTVAVALIVAGALALLLHRRSSIGRLFAAARETRRRRVAGILLAFLFTVVWMLTTFNTDGTIATANRAVGGNVAFWMDEAIAVLNGHGPLVDFHSQYGQLLPYLSAGVMRVFGTGLGVYSAVMVTGTVAALMAIYAVFRRIVNSSWIALALFAPFVATGFFMELGPLDNRYGPANLFSLFPTRYGGPYLVAWLIARHLDRATPRRSVVIFLVAAVVLVNNVDFGTPAFGATLAALLLTARPSRPHLLRLLRNAAAGLIGAGILVSLMTLAVTGSLPHFGMMLTFSRIYGIDGFGMIPMPTLGFHLVIYVTFVAALVAATVRMIGGADDRVLTGMLAWSGVFGLGAGSYFVGRSHPEVLNDVFSAWALALSFLVIVAVRAIQRRPSRRPMLAELLVLAGFGLIACSLAQTPTPWSQIDRLNHTTHRPNLALSRLEHFLERTTSPGEPVAIMNELGQRIAYDVGIDDVNPYANVGSMPLRSQLREMVRSLRAAHGHLVVISLSDPLQEQVDALHAEGFGFAAVDKPSGAFEMSDTSKGASVVIALRSGLNPALP